MEVGLCVIGILRMVPVGNCLNPCFSGSWVVCLKLVNCYWMPMAVLILVLVEVGLCVVLSSAFVKVPEVLILVLVEVGLCVTELNW